MAILDGVPGIKAEIIVDGEPLHEYDDVEEKERTPKSVTKYIEVVSGAEFMVQYQVQDPFRAKHSIAVNLFVDGKEATGRIISRPSVSLGKPYKLAGVRQRVGSRYFEQKFSFTELHTDDSGLARVNDKLMKDLEEIGDIVLKFRWVTLGKSRKAAQKDTQFDKLDKIPEEAFKGRAISHQASLKPSQRIRSYGDRPTHSLGDGEPFATFVFKYRSLAALKALCIVPRSPSPVQLEERDVDDLTAEEMRELIRRQREREAMAGLVKQESIKRERVETLNSHRAVVGDNNDVSFIRASKRARLPSTINEDGTVTIDLT